MSTDLPIEYRIRDALHWFMRDRAANTERENQEPFSDETSYLLAESLERLLKDRKLKAYAAFERENGVWIFVVCGAAAHRVEPLLDRERPSRIEVEFLGPLHGGRYTEHFSLVPGVEGQCVEVRFEHAKLPAGAIEFDLEPFAPNARTSPNLVERREQLEQLRVVFQEWSSWAPQATD